MGPNANNTIINLKKIQNDMLSYSEEGSIFMRCTYIARWLLWFIGYNSLCLKCGLF